jgi:hypothetical protein
MLAGHAGEGGEVELMRVLRQPSTGEHCGGGWIRGGRSLAAKECNEREEKKGRAHG